MGIACPLECVECRAKLSWNHGCSRELTVLVSKVSRQERVSLFLYKWQKCTKDFEEQSGTGYSSGISLLVMKLNWLKICRILLCTISRIVEHPLGSEQYNGIQQTPLTKKILPESIQSWNH